MVNGKVIGKEIDFPEDTGVIIETPGFIPYYSGYKNLKVPGDLRGNISKADIYQYMKMVELDPKLKRAVRKYSLGMLQRLGLAQALMEQPKLLILDEPFNGLDKNMTEKIRKVILGEKEKGTAILLSSHNPIDIELLCDKVYYLDGGKTDSISNSHLSKQVTPSPVIPSQNTSNAAHTNHILRNT